MSCYKYGFESKEIAQLKLDYIIEVSDRPVKPNRVYLCDKCGKYHLTSKTIEEYKKAQSY